MTQLTFHHLIPRKLHRRNHYRRHYTRNSLQHGINICRQCHNGIHKQYDEMTLARQLNNLQALRNDERLQKYFAWVTKQKTRN